MMPILSLHQPMAYGTLIERYKRFLADVRLDSGEIITAHCPNPGRMISCSEPGSRVRLSFFENTSRKYPYRLDLVHNGQCWIGVNPNLANEIVDQAIQNQQLFSELDLSGWRREVRYATSHRIDFLHESATNTYVEVKSVTYNEDGVGYFPDAVSKRATQHLGALKQMVENGHRSVILYCIQREDTTLVKPAKHIDHAYANAYDLAIKSGVEMMPLYVRFDEYGHHVFM